MSGHCNLFCLEHNSYLINYKINNYKSVNLIIWTIFTFSLHFLTDLLPAYHTKVLFH